VASTDSAGGNRWSRRNNGRIVGGVAQLVCITARTSRHVTILLAAKFFALELVTPVSSPLRSLCPLQNSLSVCGGIVSSGRKSRPIGGQRLLQAANAGGRRNAGSRRLRDSGEALAQCNGDPYLRPFRQNKAEKKP